jgi:mono/diheme cytochrome c family protein
MLENERPQPQKDTPPMRRTITAAAGLAVLVLGTHPSQADGIGNPARGLEYAKANCAGCHSILKDETESSPNPDSPAFAAVAATPGITRTALSVFLQSPHPTMPNLIVAGEDADNLIAYILSLKTPAETKPN